MKSKPNFAAPSASGYLFSLSSAYRFFWWRCAARFVRAGGAFLCSAGVAHFGNNTCYTYLYAIMCVCVCVFACLLRIVAEIVVCGAYTLTSAFAGIRSCNSGCCAMRSSCFILCLFVDSRCAVN